MKLKAGIKKEDLAGYVIKTSTAIERKNIQKLFNTLNIAPTHDPFIKENDDFDSYAIVYKGDRGSLCYHITSSNEFLEGVKLLSDLIEEEYPEYVRWIGASKKGFINGGVYKTEQNIFLGDCLMIENGNKIFGSQCNYSFHKSMKGEDNVEHATKEEYEAQNTYTGYATEALAEQAKEWEEQHPSKEKYEISIEQIKTLHQLGIVDHLLKEWFPNAGIFKEKERTYKIGDRFTWEEDGEVWQINRSSEEGLQIALNNEKGEILRRSVDVDDVYAITRKELLEIRPDLFDKMSYND